MTIVALVLAKRLAMVAKNDEQRFLKQPARFQSFKEFSQYRVAVM